MRDRLRPPRDLESVLDRMKDEGPFDTKQKAFMFAASVGYARRADCEGGLALDAVGEGIRLEYFERQGDDGFVAGLAVAHEGSLSALAVDRSDERLEIFERYAHSGLEQIADLLTVPGATCLRVVLDLIDRLKTNSAGDLPGLDRDVEQVADFL